MPMNKTITKAVAEATWAAIQTLSEVQSQRPEEKRGPKLGGPILKQPLFNLGRNGQIHRMESFYTRGKKCTFHVQNPITRQVCHGKELAGQEGSTLFTELNRDIKTCMQHFTGTIQHISCKIQASIQ